MKGKKVRGGRDIIRTLYAQADRPADVPAVTGQVEEALRSRHRARAQYHVENLSSILELAHHVSITLTAVLLLFALIALTISGVGIMNITLVSVTERTHEIASARPSGHTDPTARCVLSWSFAIQWEHTTLRSPTEAYPEA